MHEYIMLERGGGPCDKLESHREWVAIFHYSLSHFILGKCHPVGSFPWGGGYSCIHEIVTGRCEDLFVVWGLLRSAK